jgi:DNA-binding XRE family transcriptional regulator
MNISVPILLGGFLVYLAIAAVIIILVVLVIRALLKYIRSDSIRKEKERVTRSLGEALKENRTRCNMTQAFVAESIGVSRQAVSKWESGTSDPSTSNLLSLAKLYGISAEDLLKEVE